MNAMLAGQFADHAQGAQGIATGVEEARLQHGFVTERPGQPAVTYRVVCRALRDKNGLVRIALDRADLQRAVVHLAIAPEGQGAGHDLAGLGGRVQARGQVLANPGDTSLAPGASSRNNASVAPRSLL